MTKHNGMDDHFVLGSFYTQKKVFVYINYFGILMHKIRSPESNQENELYYFK